jgi:hypothetical protein
MPAFTAKKKKYIMYRHDVHPFTWSSALLLWWFKFFKLAATAIISIAILSGTAFSITPFAAFTTSTWQRLCCNSFNMRVFNLHE